MADFKGEVCDVTVVGRSGTAMQKIDLGRSAINLGRGLKSTWAGFPPVLSLLRHIFSWERSLRTTRRGGVRPGACAA